MKYLLALMFILIAWSCQYRRKSDTIGKDINSTSAVDAISSINVDLRDTIDILDVSINGFRLSLPQDSIIGILGNPDSSYLIVDEESSPIAEFEVFTYRKSILYFYDGLFSSITIEDKSISIGEEKISIGTDISTLSSLYPLSFNNKEDREYQELTVIIKNRKNVNDLYSMTFEYTDQGIVERIIVRFLE